MQYVKKLGFFKKQSDATIPTGLLAPVSGDCQVRAHSLGKTTVSTLTITSGAEVKIPNDYNEDATVTFTVRLPDGLRDDYSGYPANSGINFLTTPNGEIAFEFVNVP